ncbi:MAG: hypothetical protein ACOC07_09140, partial [Coleofasciculus sp.]
KSARENAKNVSLMITPKGKTISVGIRLEPQDWENLNQLAASLGMTRTELITQISRVQNPQDLQAFQKAKYLGESSAN